MRNKTRQGYALKKPLKLTGYFVLGDKNLLDAIERIEVSFRTQSAFGKQL